MCCEEIYVAFSAIHQERIVRHFRDFRLQASGVRCRYQRRPEGLGRLKWSVSARSTTMCRRSFEPGSLRHFTREDTVNFSPFRSPVAV
jgi:hypothetical protein